MSEYLLHRDVFHWLAYSGKAVEGDYLWDRVGYVNEHSTTRVYRRDHVPTGNLTFWICDDYDASKAVMCQVQRVPLVSYEWRRL